MKANTVKLDGTVIDRVRRRLLLPVGQLAERAGLSIRTVWNARRGRPVDFETVRSLAKALNVDVADLVQEGRQ